MIERYISGNIACAEGAVKAGCRFFAGYPITPSTEIAEHMAVKLPKAGGIFIQMEDEIASMATILGASWAGVKAMTTTSGPGFSLMQENIGLGVMTETPCVIVDVQRGGPSTGLPTLVAQADMMQARWGSHGQYEIIALCPSSPQEMFDLTISAFNLSERYRTPVLVMGDEVVGHMCEKVVIPDKVELVKRRVPNIKPETYLPFKCGSDLVPEMAVAGSGYRIHVTGLTHDERGYPCIDAETQERMIKRINDKIRKNASEIECVDEKMTDDADIIVVSYGISARVAMNAVNMARRNNIKAGLFRLVTAWPFPEKRLKALASKVKGFVVVELNYGQMYYEVERCALGKKLLLVSKMGGEVHKPEDIYKTIKKVI